MRVGECCSAPIQLAFLDAYLTRTSAVTFRLHELPSSPEDPCIALTFLPPASWPPAHTFELLVNSANLPSNLSHLWSPDRACNGCYSIAAPRDNLKHRSAHRLCNSESQSRIPHKWKIQSRIQSRIQSSVRPRSTTVNSNYLRRATPTHLRIHFKARRRRKFLGYTQAKLSCLTFSHL